MKLYSEPDSPFSAAVRLAVYAKALDIEIVAPPGGLLSARYHAINPVGTIPCLMLADDVPLAESAAILEYLEDRFPACPLLAGAPEERARIRLRARIAELGILTPLIRLPRPPRKGDAVAGQWLTRLVRGLATLNQLVGSDPGGAVTLADCFIVPALFMLPRVAGPYVRSPLIDAYPALRAYAEHLADDAHVARVESELAASWR